MTRTLRIGCGAGFSSDRLDPAVDLAVRGNLDWLAFECVGERTLAFGHRDRLADPQKGYNAFLEARLRAVLAPCIANGTRIITNMGVANPRAAAHKAAAIARELGHGDIVIACLEGDEVTAMLTGEEIAWENGEPLSRVRERIVGANAYLGIEALAPAVASEAAIIITGRVADPSLFLAPAAAHHGWRHDDWPRIGAGTAAGHLLECGMQITGGYFADPGVKDVPDLARCGYPIGEIEADGTVTITKLEGTGGLVSERTVKEQLYYEVHDPAAYLTPDCTADFSKAAIEEVGTNRVRVTRIEGREAPTMLKVTVGLDGGFLAEAGISYGGVNAGARANLAREILKTRLSEVHGIEEPVRIDLIGLDSLHGTALGRKEVPDARDVRLRAALRSDRRETGELLLWEVESLLCCGPAGGGGYRGRLTPSVTTLSTSIAREAVAPRVSLFRAGN